MNLSKFDLINEVFFAEEVTPLQLDFLLAEGWRHFGQHFFRYNVGFYKNGLRYVMPLRVRTADFVLSGSQKRVVRKNKDTKCIIRPVEFDDVKHELFRVHAERFTHGKPENLYSFLDEKAATVPCCTYEFCVFVEDRLAAVSYLDIGDKSVSSIYAMFDPVHSKRSLGIYTMLLELQYAQEQDKEFYYQGYAYEGESFYDYKKRLAATEVYDWHGRWEDMKP
ncbi:MAG: arginine-tRNA-protein transferase [Pyrinomonadaceae bacterium]|nr:arginine-tRNA-protein transferase [Pyrinomonadaceae bacterium]